MGFRKLCSLIGIVTTITCCAQENSIHSDQDAVVLQVLENAHSCVKGYHQQRIYLKEEKIHATAEGVFLDLSGNGDYIQLPILHSNSAGCFLETTQNGIENFGFDTKVTKPCPFCGWQRISYAIKCPNPDCPSNQPKK